MVSIESLEQELYETEGNIEGLRETLATNRARDLVRIITPTGKMKGEVTGLTPLQYRELIGVYPSPRLLRKIEGQTTDKIPWHLILDQLASERGFDSDEDLREAILSAKDDQRELERLQHTRDVLIEDIRGKVKEGIVGVETFILQRESEYPDGVLKEEVIEIDGSTVKAYRQHSFWTIEVDWDGDGKLDHKFRIRYARGARRIIRMAVKDVSERERMALKPRKKVRYTAKRRARVSRPTATTLKGIR